MGVVYKVAHTYFDRKYFVLKTLAPAVGENKDVARRMHREARILGGIDHPNIVQVLDGGLLENGAPYFLMEFLDGATLDEVIARAPKGIGIKSAVGIGIEICDALDVLHVDNGIIHRDLKPENIFLERLPNDGTRGLSISGLRARTKLLDFGIVHLMSGSKGATGKIFIGTLHYAAPEQLKGARVTPRTDLYAFGVVLYEMLSGRHVFAGVRTKDMGEAHIHLSPEPISKYAAVPPDLGHLVMSCLEKEPDRRPKSARSLAADLRRVLERFRADPSPSVVVRNEPSGVEIPLEIVCAQRTTERRRRDSSRDSVPTLRQRLGRPPPDAGGETEERQQQVTQPMPRTDCSSPPSDPPSERQRPTPAPTQTMELPVARGIPRVDTEPIPTSPAYVRDAPSPVPDPSPEVARFEEILEGTRYVDPDALYGRSVTEGPRILPAAGLRPPPLGREHGRSAREGVTTLVGTRGRVRRALRSQLARNGVALAVGIAVVTYVTVLAMRHREAVEAERRKAHPVPAPSAASQGSGSPSGSVPLPAPEGTATAGVVSPAGAYGKTR